MGRIPERLLKPKSEDHSVGWTCKHQEERIAGGADLGRLRKLGQQSSDHGVVFLDTPNSEPVAHALLELGGTHQIGEHQGHQAGLMLSTEGGDPAFAAGILNFSIHQCRR